MVDDPFRGPSRARNMEPLPWVGDPERWGGSITVEVVLNPAGATDPVFSGTIVRAQTRDLVAVGWDLVGTWDVVSGYVKADDTVQVVWRVTVGTGQNTSSLIWDLGSRSPAGLVPNPQALALGWSSFSDRGAVALSGQPIIATNLNAQLIVLASTAGVGHTLRVSCTGHCAPRSWVP